jgi:hypothetical protein
MTAVILHFYNKRLSESRASEQNQEQPMGAGWTAYGTYATRPHEIWHMDTFGPTKTKSLYGFYYNTTWTCGFSGYCLSYGHNSTAKLPEIQERWYADFAGLRGLHGDPRVLRCDNASVNISASATSFYEARGIRTETSCPYESHQMGTAERMNRTLETIARTVLLASGMDKRWDFSYGVQNWASILWWFPIMLYLVLTALDPSVPLSNCWMNLCLRLNSRSYQLR